MLVNSSVHLLQGSWLLALEIQRRCFHVSPLAAAASKVAMSKFDRDTPLPYEKLQKNLEIVKKRYLDEVLLIGVQKEVCRMYFHYSVCSHSSR
jgi:hypothetical protein